MNHNLPKVVLKVVKNIEASSSTVHEYSFEKFMMVNSLTCKSLWKMSSGAL